MYQQMREAEGLIESALRKLNAAASCAPTPGARLELARLAERARLLRDDVYGTGCGLGAESLMANQTPT